MAAGLSVPPALVGGRNKAPETAQGMRKGSGAQLQPRPSTAPPRTDPDRTVLQVPRVEVEVAEAPSFVRVKVSERPVGHCTENSEQRRCREVRSNVLRALHRTCRLGNVSCLVPYTLLALLCSF